MAVFDIQDRASVEAWKERAEKLNEKARQIVTEAAHVLEEFKQTAEGQIFDQVVVYSSNVIAGTNKILEGMNEILQVVNDLVKQVMDKIKELMTNTKDTDRRVIGVR